MLEKCLLCSAQAIRAECRFGAFTTHVHEISRTSLYHFDAMALDVGGISSVYFEQLDRMQVALHQLDEAVVATAVVLALLERDEAARADIWRPAAAKARAWLGGQHFDATQVIAAPIR